MDDMADIMGPDVIEVGSMPGILFALAQQDEDRAEC